MDIEPGSRRLFDYLFKDDAYTTNPELRGRTGQIVTVVRPLSPEEFEDEVGPMFVITFDDGYTSHAWGSELPPITA